MISAENLSYPRTEQEVNKINSIRIKYMFKCDTNLTLTTMHDPNM